MPDIARLLRKLVSELTTSKPFQNSASYWEDRYRTGGTSGAGSYDELAEFKAEIINEFVKSKDIQTVIEHGCGDGNQLTYSNYPSYVGFDVSPEAIAICKRKFAGDSSKAFKINTEYSNETAELSLSLDVIYHLVEDDVYLSYMERLFASARRFVIIYSSNTEGGETMDHVRHRQFTDYVERNYPEWRLAKVVPNKHLCENEGSSDTIPCFFIYETNGASQQIAPA